MQPRADTRREPPWQPAYTTLEKLAVSRPVDRLAHIEAWCRDKVVLDIGCLDETALVKRDTQHWLHGRIARVARQVVGVDASERIPEGGLQTGPASRIHRGDAMRLDPALVRSAAFDVVVAGEFIEHVSDPLQFLAHLRSALPGRELVLSTPNGPSAANALVALACVRALRQRPPRGAPLCALRALAGHLISRHRGNDAPVCRGRRRPAVARPSPGRPGSIR